MATFQAWTFAAARNASRRALFQITEAPKVGLGILQAVEQPRDVDLADNRFDAAAIERAVDT